METKNKILLNLFEIKKNKNILIVDDDENITAVLKRIISSHGYNCSAITDSRKTFEFVEKNLVDVIVTDVNMPHMSGLEVIKEIRKRYGIYGPRIIIISGCIGALSEDFIMKNRVGYVMSKPFADIMA